MRNIVLTAASLLQFFPFFLFKSYLKKEVWLTKNAKQAIDNLEISL